MPTRLVQVGDEPNCLADKRRIAPGLKVEGQNYVGSFEDDKGRFTELVERFLPVGFYYKSFHEKKTSWKAWEPIIRAMAGLGKADLKADFHHSYYDKQYLFADVAVVGGGPAGMAAALERGRERRRGRSHRRGRRDRRVAVVCALQRRRHARVPDPRGAASGGRTAGATSAC